MKPISEASAITVAKYNLQLEKLELDRARENDKRVREEQRSEMERMRAELEMMRAARDGGSDNASGSTGPGGRSVDNRRTGVGNSWFNFA